MRKVEVEQVVAHLKSQGRPAYLETVTAEEEEELEEEEAVFDKGAIASEDGDDLYDKAVKIVRRELSKLSFFSRSFLNNAR